MATLFANLQGGTLTDAPLSSGATSANSAAFANLPTVTAPDVLYLTLDPEALNGPPEIVQVTAHAGGATSVTIVRARQSTTARAHPVSTVWIHALTKTDIETFALEADLTLAEAATTALAARVTTAEADITALEAADVSLDSRVDTLETSATSLDTRLDTAESEIDALQAADTALDTRLDTAESEIDALQAADISLDSRLDTAESDINAIESVNSSQGSTISTHTSQIAALQAHDSAHGFVGYDFGPSSDSAATGDTTPVSSGAAVSWTADPARVYEVTYQVNVATTVSGFHQAYISGATTEGYLVTQWAPVGAVHLHFHITVVESGLSGSQTRTGMFGGVAGASCLGTFGRAAKMVVKDIT